MPRTARTAQRVSRYLRMLAILGISLAVALSSPGAAPAAGTQAGVLSDVDTLDTVLMYSLPSDTTKDHDRYPSRSTLAVGDGSVEAYGLEIEVPFDLFALFASDWEADPPKFAQQGWSDYVPSSTNAGWDDNKQKILWLLKHSAPAVEPADVLTRAEITGVAANDANGVVRDATQSAIWHFASGAELLLKSDLRDQDDGSMALVATDPKYLLYQWFLVNAEDEPISALPEPAFDRVTTSGTAGDTLGPVVVTAPPNAAINVALPAGVILRVDQSGATADLRGTVNGFGIANGASLSLVVPAGTAAGSVDVTVSASVPIAAPGTIWRAVEQPGQTFITATSTNADLVSTTNFAWSVPATGGVHPPVPVGVQSPSGAPGPGTTSVPKPTSAPITPTPTVRRDPAGRVPVAKPRKPVLPTARTVVRTFQVDRYMPVTVRQARVVASLDDDRRLRYREDRALWGASRHQFVSIRVPAKATEAQVISAINARTAARIGDVSTSRPLRTARPGGVYVMAWELAPGANPRLPWGKSLRASQVFVARS